MKQGINRDRQTALSVWRSSLGALCLFFLLTIIFAGCHSATPDQPEVWKELLDAGVDLLNADDLAGLQKFLLSRQPR